MIALLSKYSEINQSAHAATVAASNMAFPLNQAANLTAPYDKVTVGDTQQSEDRFITGLSACSRRKADYTETSVERASDLAPDVLITPH